MTAPATGGGSGFAVKSIDHPLPFGVAPFGGPHRPHENEGDGRADIIVVQSNGRVAAILSDATHPC